VIGWGFDLADVIDINTTDAPAGSGYSKPGTRKVELFPLRHMVEGNSFISLPALPPGKSEIDVSADFLLKVRMALKSELQTSLGELFSREEKNIHYYFTIPGIWNDAGQKSLRAAIIQAGYLRDENDNRLNFVTVGEAAALHCLKLSMLKVQVKDVVLIVDCGAGRADVQACELISENPYCFVEYTSGSGDSCGSDYPFSVGGGLTLLLVQLP
jgi:hypothetical protein